MQYFGCIFTCVFCVFPSNAKQLSELFFRGEDRNLMPRFNFSDPTSLALEDYRAWFKEYSDKVSGTFTDCDIEKEMQKVKMKFMV